MLSGTIFITIGFLGCFSWCYKINKRSIKKKIKWVIFLFPPFFVCISRRILKNLFFYCFSYALESDRVFDSLILSFCASERIECGRITHGAFLLKLKYLWTIQKKKKKRKKRFLVVWFRLFLSFQLADLWKIWNANFIRMGDFCCVYIQVVE